MIKVNMYTQNSCPNCKRAKFMMGSCPVEIELNEINIDEKPLAKAYLESKLVSSTLPTFVIKEEGKKPKIIRGFQEGELMDAFGL